MLRHVIRDAVEVTSYSSRGWAVVMFSVFIDYNINNTRFQACLCRKQRLSPEECACLLIVNQLFVQNNKDNVMSLLRGVFVVLCERMLGRRSNFHRHVAVGSKVLGMNRAYACSKGHSCNGDSALVIPGPFQKQKRVFSTVNVQEHAASLSRKDVSRSVQLNST